MAEIKNCQCGPHPPCCVDMRGKMILHWAVGPRDDLFSCMDLTGGSGLCAEDSRGLCVASQRK